MISARKLISLCVFALFAALSLQASAQLADKKVLTLDGFEQRAEAGVPHLFHGQLELAARLIQRR